MTEQLNYSLLLTGDSIIHRRYVHLKDPSIRRLVELIQAADVAFTNLEILPNDFEGFPSEESGGTHFGAPRWVLDELTALGFDLFACATNHSLDYGIHGLTAVMETLNQRGVAFAGVGNNLAESRLPAYFDHATGSIAMISCCSTFATGQPAAPARPDFRGRPGLNPLRQRQVLELPQHQFDQLRAIASDLGLEQRRRQRQEMGFARPPSDPAMFPFLDQHFRPASEARIVTELDEPDFEDQLRWAREAKARADHLLVSLHTHEQGATQLDPPGFVVDFAHRMIDGGADVVVMHGPHQLRGIELYQGKPIFHSLGNFFGQNELTYILPADTYRRFGADADDLPSQAFEARSQGGTASFPAFPQYWESVVPICRYEQGTLAEIELIPIELKFGQAVHRRGRPHLAVGEHARAILERLAGLCEPFGTTLAIDGERATVRL